jgi:hypothetical protein
MTLDTTSIATLDSVRSGTAITPVLIEFFGVTISQARSRFASTSL